MSTMDTITIALVWEFVGIVAAVTLLRDTGRHES